MSEFTGYTDLPVETLEQDKFNLSKYVTGLGKFILECDTPMTISIQGDWGSGKTSMMKMIQNNLGDKILPIWFNTWQFSQFSLGNSLAISMIDVLLRELGGDTTVLDKIANGASTALKNAFFTALELTAGSRATGKIENLIDSYSSTNCVNEIKTLKQQFENATNSKSKRVVVFVDDLDRLDPAKAIELLEVLKIFLDCKNCVFILAVDYEIVTLGIRQKYGDTINAAKGKSFFEKIIQLPFKMPVASYDIEKYTRSMMEKMQISESFSKSGDNLELFINLIKNSVGLNPRGMKRLFNTYRLLYNVLPTENQEPSVTATQKVRENFLRQRILFAAVCMQMSFESVYDYLSAGNIDTDILEHMNEIDAKAVRHFLKRRSESSNIEVSSEELLDILFDSKIPFEELSFQLQKFPKFIKNFILAIHTEKDDKISDKELKIFRDIMRSASITSVNSGNNIEPSNQMIERRQKNREIVKKTNAELSKSIGEFIMPQTKSNNAMSSEAIGYYIFKHSDKEYHFRYVLDSDENKNFTVSIYLNGMNQDAQQFYKSMGNNPLKYEQTPVMNVEPGWYFYDDIFKFSGNDELVIESASQKITDAYNRLQNLLNSLSKF